MDKFYETPRLILRTLGDSVNEAEMVLDYFKRNSEYFKPWDPLRTDEFYTVDSRKDALAWELNAMMELGYLRLWIFKKEDLEYKKIIGTIGITNIARGIFFSCKLGYSIDKEEANKGYMTEAVKKSVDIAFNEYGLHRIEATIMPGNKPSLRVVEKLGFVNEGLSRSYQKINGKWEDHVHMVLLDE